MREETPLKEVCLVLDTPLRRHLLLEVTRGPVSGRGALSAAQRALLREAAITAQLDHPAIIPVYDAGLDREGRAWLTRKVLDSVAVDEPRDGRLDWKSWGLERRLQALVAACEAIDYAHRRGVVHADLAADRIRVGAFGETYATAGRTHGFSGGRGRRAIARSDPR